MSGVNMDEMAIRSRVVRGDSYNVVYVLSVRVLCVIV
jgi:hypothetical protein